MQLNLPDLFDQLMSDKQEDGQADGANDDGKKSSRQKRGGKALVKTKQKKDVEKFVKLARCNRGKKKYVTSEYLN